MFALHVLNTNIVLHVPNQRKLVNIAKRHLLGDKWVHHFAHFSLVTTSQRFKRGYIALQQKTKDVYPPTENFSSLLHYRGFPGYILCNKHRDHSQVKVLGWICLASETNSSPVNMLSQVLTLLACIVVPYQVFGIIREKRKY